MKFSPKIKFASKLAVHIWTKDTFQRLVKNISYTSWLLNISGEFKNPTNQAIQLLDCVTKILADAYKTSFTSLWESVFNLDHELELWQNFYWTQLMHQKCNLLYCGRIIFENVLYGKFTLTLFPQKYLISLKWKRIFAIEKHW